MADPMADLGDEQAMARRAYGTGSVTQRKRDGKWVATLEAGWTERGTRRRVSRVRSTKRAAQTALRDLMREAEQRQSPRVGGKPTVKTWADQWLETAATEMRPTAWQATRSQVTRWIIPTIGHKRLDQLTPGDRRALTRAMFDAGLAQSSVNRAQAVLAGMLGNAVSEGHHVPPAALRLKSTKSESDRDAIPFEDAFTILATATTRPDVSRWIAALLQGMRPAECLGLTWDAVDLDSGSIDVSWQMKPLPYKIPRDRASGFRVPDGYVARHLHGSAHLVRPKTESGRRVIPLVPLMHDALSAWAGVCPPSPARLVWPRVDGTPRSDSEDRAAWADLCDTAQVASVDGTQGRRYALYEARHTAATLLRQTGVDDETIQAIMGHATILSTKAYLHTDPARTRAALEKVAARLALD